MTHRLRVLSIMAAAIAVSLLAAMALPAAAHHRDGHDRGDRSQSQDEDEDRSESKGQSKSKRESKSKAEDGSSSSQGGSSGQESSSSSDRVSSEDEDHGASGKKSKARAEGEAGVEAHGNRAGGNKHGFPYEVGSPGNNGTVKVRSTGGRDGNRRNEPHPGCEFWLHFWHFDEPATGTATFRAHPPTGGNREALLTDEVDVGWDQLISGPYDLVEEFMSLGISPHPKQGYHVKLTQESDFSLGARKKHKVFWINCPVEADVVPHVPPAVPPDDEVLAEVIEVPVEPDVPPAVPPDDEVLAEVSEVPVEPEPEVLALRVAAPEEPEVRPGEVEEEPLPAPVLPVTGASILVFLLAGLALIGAGAGLYRARRP